MRIAIPYENGQVFQHFGQTQRFKVYETKQGAVEMTSVVNTNGSGHGALADLLAKGEIEVVICGGIGPGAQKGLAKAGIKWYGGVTGEADQAVKDFLQNKLSYNPMASCNHHDEKQGEEHHCGEHGCGGSESGCQGTSCSVGEVGNEDEAATCDESGCKVVPISTCQGDSCTIDLTEGLKTITKL